MRARARARVRPWLRLRLSGTHHGLLAGLELAVGSLERRYPRLLRVRVRVRVGLGSGLG